MKNKKVHDTLVQEIERGLKFGRFIEDRSAWDFIGELEGIQKKIDALVRAGEAARAITLYEVFLSGCDEKAEELDDSSGSFGIFFVDLFCSWIKARHKAGLPADETVKLILRWMENDTHSLCYGSEEDIALALDKKGLQFFTRHYTEKFEKAYTPFLEKGPGNLHEYPGEVQRNAKILKEIFLAKKDLASYKNLFEKFTMSPDDCEALAKVQQEKGLFEDALATVERGIALKSKDNWRLEGFSLSPMKQELLARMGKMDDAFAAAWKTYENAPSRPTFDAVMKYCPEERRLEWQKKAIELARNSSLWTLIEICTEANAWDTLAEHVIDVEDQKIETISHYVTEGAANGLSRSHGLAAAKIFRALGFRIMNSAKSQYYHHALRHFKKARDLYEKSGRADLWQSIVLEVRKKHARKFSFIGSFEALAAGKNTKKPLSFEEKMRTRWEKRQGFKDGKGDG